MATQSSLAKYAVYQFNKVNSFLDAIQKLRPMEDIGLIKINMNIKNMEGDCLCGAVRYCVSGSPFATEYCHYGMCQKTSGTPVVAGWTFTQTS